MDRIHVAHHCQNHVGGGVECLVAVVQRLRCDVGDTLHRPGDRGPGSALLVQGLHHPGVELPVGVVLDHADLLADDPTLLFHALPGEIGDGDEGEQGPKVLLKMLGGLKIIAGDGVAGKGVGGGPVGRQLLERVALSGVEHLVLQVVGNARRCVQPLTVQTEAGVHPAVPGGKEGVLLGVLRLGDHADLQSVGQHLPVDGLADPLVKRLLHSAVSFPFRKYTVSRETVCMASKMRSAVTCRTCSASSSGVSSCPVAAWPR